MTALAHTHDPDTSHDAAARLDPDTVSAVHAAILELLEHGPATAERIATRYAYLAHEVRNGWPRVGFFTVHKRMSDLHKKGLIRNSGRRDVVESGATAVVWEVVS